MSDSGTRQVRLADESAGQAFQSTIRGKLIRPEDPDYETARRVHNGMIDRRPALIVQCADVADVIGAVNFARDHQLDIAIRGGAHSAPGFGTCDGGLVIDLCRMKGTRVDPARRTVQAQGGCTWGDLDHATAAFGLATPGGLISTTGIGGLTLGGGIGHLSRKYGLSCDNLISADVVTADGRLVSASASENPDLFWALRGGSGNFGVVTSFEFRLHPVSMVYAGPILYPLEKAHAALRLFSDYMTGGAPEELGAFFAFLIVPPGPHFPEALHLKTMCGVVCCYNGPLEKAPEATRPFHEFGPPAFEMTGPIPYPVVQGMFDPMVPPGLFHYWKADFTGALTDAMIEEHVKYGSQIPTVSSAVHIYPANGAIHRVASRDTAFPHRGAEFTHIVAAVQPDADSVSRNRQWVRDYWSALHPHAAGGIYVNFLDSDEGADRVAASYGSNFARLAELKKKWDPENLFHLNQNIRPAE